MRKIILFPAFIILLALLSFSISAQECETTIIYWGLCTPNGDVSVHKVPSGNLVASEAYGVFSGCYNGFYSIIIGTGGSGCDWQQGERAEFRINGNSAGTENWNGDFTRRFDLSSGTLPNPCVANGDCLYPNEVCVNGNCQPCSYDSECNPGDICLPGTGRCVPPSPGNCTDNSDCAYPNQVCVNGNCQPCTSNTQCDSDDICNNGICEPPCIDNGDCNYPVEICQTSTGLCDPCTNSSQCDTGDICDSGICNPPCTDNDDCLYPDEVCVTGTGLCDPCTNNSQCDTGDICSSGECITPCGNNSDCNYPDEVCTGGICQPCTANSDCDAGQICSNGRCGDPCTSNTNCSYPSEVCFNGICQPCSNNNQCNSGQICSSGNCVTPSQPPPPGGRRGGGGSGGGRRPVDTGVSGNCNVCGTWGECGIKGIQYRNCTTVDCGSIVSVVIPSDAVTSSVLSNSSQYFTRADGRTFRTNPSLLNQQTYRTLTMVDFTNKSEYYYLLANALSYSREEKKCTYVPSCNDGIQNDEETGIDCGGSCADCPLAETCFDGIQNQNEEGIDCGGSCLKCEEQMPLPATETSCWLWWIPLMLLLIFLGYLVYEHRTRDRDILWPLVVAIIVLIAINVALLWLCYNVGSFEIWLLLLFVLLLLAMFIGYMVYEKKEVKEKKKVRNGEFVHSGSSSGISLDTPIRRVTRDNPVKVTIAPKSSISSPSSAISGLSDASKITNIRNLMNDAHQKLDANNISEVRSLTSKISALYKTLPNSSEKENVYSEFMKLYDAIKKKVR